MSVWGFFGLLGLTAGVALACCNTERGELRIVLAADFVGRCSMSMFQAIAALATFCVTRIGCMRIFEELVGMRGGFRARFSPPR